MGAGPIPPGQLPPRQFPPDNGSPDNSHLGKLNQIIATGQFPPRIIDPWTDDPWIFIYLFIYLFILYFMLTFTIKSIKHSDLFNLLYTNS